MKKRYDAVVIGGGVAAYALAALASKAGHLLFFENEAPPAEPPWSRPLLADDATSVWQLFQEKVHLDAGKPAPFRFQILNGRERDSGLAALSSEVIDISEWLQRQLEWPAWYVRWWRAFRKNLDISPVPASAPWSSYPTGLLSKDRGVLAYLANHRNALQTPGSDISLLLRGLRALAAQEGAEFLPISKLDAVIPGEGVRVQGVGATLASENMAVCLDLGQWTQAPGLGPLPRSVFKSVKPAGVRIEARWACHDDELPVGLAGRGWWADEPQAFFEVTGKDDKSTLKVWTVREQSADIDSNVIIAAMLKVLKGYAPFFRGTMDAAKIQVTPLWQSVSSRGTGLPPVLKGSLAYAGPQSYPGWGPEGELVAAMRLHKMWFEKEPG